MFGMMRDMVATGHMDWAIRVNVVLLAVLLILGVVALFQCIVFR